MRGTGRGGSVLALATAAVLVGTVPGVASDGAVMPAPGRWVTHGPQGADVRDFVFDPVDPRTVYTATTGGVYASLDGGVPGHSRGRGLSDVGLESLGVAP